MGAKLSWLWQQKTHSILILKAWKGQKVIKSLRALENLQSEGFGVYKKRITKSPISMENCCEMIYEMGECLFSIV